MSKLQKNKYVIFGSPKIGSMEIKEVLSTLKSGWIGTGPKAKKFESDFAKFKKTNYAIALNSCTAALHLGLLSLNLKPGDEVITTPLTFCSTINSIIHTGAKPVLVDVEEDSMNINTKLIEEKITNKTKCILPVHLAGRSCNMKEIIKIKKKYNLFLIEDCAHAIETTFNGNKAGTFGDIGCFSFYATKNLAVGEGGMLISNNKKIISRVKKLSIHGMNKDAWNRYGKKGFNSYTIDEPGYKYNMSDLQASIGIHQLKQINKFRKKRKEIWDLYNNSFKNLDIHLPNDDEKRNNHAYHLYTIRLNRRSKVNRDTFIKLMHLNKIGTGIHYRSITNFNYYKKNYNWKDKDYPIANKIGKYTCSLPLSPSMSLNDVERVIKAVKKILS